MCTDLLHSACEGVIFTFCAVSGTNWFLLETIATFVVFSYLQCFVLFIVIIFAMPQVWRKGINEAVTLPVVKKLIWVRKKRGEIAPGETLHIRCRKKTVQKTLPAVGWLHVGFYFSRAAFERWLLFECSTLAAPTSGRKAPVVKDSRLVIMCHFIKGSKNQVLDLLSVVTLSVNKWFAVVKSFKKQPNLAGIWSSSFGFCPPLKENDLKLSTFNKKK